jgi:hypothetical protein
MPSQLRELLSGEHLAGMQHKCSEQPELGAAGQLDALAVDLDSTGVPVNEAVIEGGRRAIKNSGPRPPVPPSFIWPS